MMKLEIYNLKALFHDCKIARVDNAADNSGPKHLSSFPKVPLLHFLLLKAPDCSDVGYLD